MPKNIRKRKDSSESEEEHVEIKEKIEDLKFLQKSRVKSSGIDSIVLAMGDSSKLNNNIIKINNDPWKLKSGGLVDMKLLKKNDVLNNMNNNFARETNQRDEDAEMQKFIEEQLKSIKNTQNKLNEQESELISEKKIKRPDDALFDVPKHLLSNTSKLKSEETLSEQMLSGIPEVDLGVEERIRNIEETERAKQQLLYGTNSKQKKDDDASYSSNNQSVNFVQHKRFDDALINPDRMIKPKTKILNKNINKEPLPVVGDAEKHELLQKDDESTRNKELKRPHNNRASDDYCLERFKKNMRFSRNTKIKIA